MQEQDRKNIWIFALSLVLASQQFLINDFMQAAYADSISPNITSGGKVYSEERPNREFFGTGMSGRLGEASYLRFTGEQALDDGDLATAIKRLGKAVQLDPGDPGGHLLYARALTGKVNKQLRKSDELDQELLCDCIEEWKLIWHHDADISEQAEARAQVRRLVRIAKLLNQESEGKLAHNDKRMVALRERKKLTGKEAPKLAERDGLGDDKAEASEFRNMTNSHGKKKDVEIGDVLD